MLVLANNKTVKNISDLINKKIGVRLGTTASDYAHTIRAEVVDFDSGSAMLLALLNKKVDIVIDEKLVNEYLLSAKKTKKKFKIIDNSFNSKSYAFAISKKHPKPAKDFDRAIDTLKKNGEWEKIIQKWFDEEYEKYFK
jgi:polar amino acid transport system substrate-binding protein